MLFNYKAKQGLDSISEGTINAAGRDDALGLLLQRGLHPFFLEPAVAERSVPVSRIAKKKYKSNQPVNGKQLYEFTQKLRTLTRSHVPLIQSLQMLYEQSDHPAFRGHLSELSRAVKEGMTFSEALQRHGVFPPIYYNLVRAGEVSGRLEVALEALCVFLGSQEALKNKLRTALAYPLLLVIVGAFSTAVLLMVVIPQLQPLLSQSRGPLPLATRLVLGISIIARRWFPLIVIATAAGVLILMRRGGGWLRRKLPGIVSRLPLLKRLQFEQDMIYISHSLSLLLQGGIPAVRALELVIPGIAQARLSADMRRALERVANGQNLWRSLNDSTVVPSFFRKMIAVGEESGHLAEVMGEIAGSYREQLESDVALLGALVEPLLILCMGIVLGTTVMSVLLPIFQLTQGMQ